MRKKRLERSIFKMALAVQVCPAPCHSVLKERSACRRRLAFDRQSPEILAFFFPSGNLIQSLCTVILLCLTLLPLSVQAQTPAHGHSETETAQAEASSDPSHLTPDQARQLLGVLDNDSKRREFTTTLRNLAAAQSVAPTDNGTKSGITAPSVAVNDNAAPRNLGNDMLRSLTSLGLTLRHEAQVLVGTIGNFRSLGPWVRHVRASSQLQNEILKILLRVAVLIGIGGALAFCVRLLLRHPCTRLEEAARQRNFREEMQERRDAQDARTAAETAETQNASEAEGGAQHSPSQTEAMQQAAVENPKVDPYQNMDEATRLAEAEQEQNERLRHQGSLAQLMMALHRLPYSLGCFLLDLLPIVMFPLTAFIMQSVDPDADSHTASALEGVAWIAGMGAGGSVALARAIFAPRQIWLRLGMFGDRASAFWFYWLRRIAWALGGGIAILVVLSSCTMPQNIITAFGKIVALTVHVMVACMILQGRAPAWHLCQRLAEHSRVPGLIRFIGHSWWVAALFFDLSLWLVWAAEIHGGYAAIAIVFLRTCVAVIIMRLVSIAAYGGLERLFRRAPAWASLSDEAQARIARYYPATRRVLGGLIGLMTVFALAVAWGAPLRDLFGSGGIGERILSSCVTLLVAVTVGVMVWEAVNIGIERHIDRISAENDGTARAARFRTLQPMFRILLMVVLIAIIGLTALSELGVNTAPLLASASIFGVALGFGSQKLVQDFISGIFLLLENALTVGDAVTLSGTYGVVEKLSLRTVHVRANDGSMNIFSFSSLSQIINYNRDFARAIIVAEVGYSVDTDDVVKALNDITAEMRADPDFKDLIIDDFQMWGVDSLNDSSVTVRGTLPTTTAGRWPVQRQFYRRMKKCFEARNIDIPFPTRTLEIEGLERLIDYRGPNGETPNPMPGHQATDRKSADDSTGPGSGAGEATGGDGGSASPGNS
ncbi:mechanosensitive ion channel domain-containing protein [Gluconobacter morbifer]|uniref:Uncharacterized protein n=1 Tax=Gluconobacter morbifer G707 TaxID=1088869 RepID=G6XMJ5_9PROT|nr:mechanosensitive ion channel domain-containing protein [Gluconobacter morbifer]EHH67093.1 hypothetical protein GMO_27130 [Gluconobacter morbifer G707]